MQRPRPRVPRRSDGRVAPPDEDFIGTCRRYLQKLDNLLDIGWTKWTLRNSRTSSLSGTHILEAEGKAAGLLEFSK